MKQFEIQQSVHTRSNFLDPDALKLFHFSPGTAKRVIHMFNPATPFDPAADVMHHYITDARDAEYVSLKHYDIRDLVPLMGHLSQMDRMKTLVVSDNKLSRLPEDLSSLSNVETLDISRNPIVNAGSIIRGLYSLPKLQHLFVTLSEEDEDQIVATLVHLKSLNGISLDVEASTRADGKAETGDQGHAAAAQSLLESLRRGTSVTVPRGYSNINSAGDVDKLLQFKQWTSDDLQFFQNLHQTVKKVSSSLSSSEEYKDFSELVDSHVRAKTRAEPDVIKKAVTQFNGKSLLLEYSFDELVRSVAKYGPDVADALHGIFQTHLQLIKEATQVVAALQVDRDRKIGALQEDLAKELLQQERVKTVGSTILSQQLSSSTPQQQHMNQLGAGDFSDIGMKMKNATGGSNSTQQLPTAQKLPPNVMSIDELRGLLQLFFDSKKKHDSANLAAKLPSETAEQHVYTFLYSRTSSDDEIKKRVSIIYSSIRHHAKSELDIEVFALILKNELDEGFWEIFAAQRSSTFDAIQSVLLESQKSSGAATSLNGFVTDEQSMQVITILMPDQHSEQHELLRKAVVRALVRDEESGHRYVISYSNLGNTILRHVVASYMASIQPIVQHFHSVDVDRSGVVSIARLRAMLGTLFTGISSARAQAIVSSADPFQNDVVTFSDVVRCLRQLQGEMSTQGSVVGDRPSTIASAKPSKAPASRSSVA